MNYEPMFGRVLVKREVFKSKSGSIIIPKSAEKRNSPPHGVVVAKGPTADESVEVGKMYVIGRHAGDWITLPGSDDDWFVCQDEDLLVKVPS